MIRRKCQSKHNNLGVEYTIPLIDKYYCVSRASAEKKILCINCHRNEAALQEANAKLRKLKAESYLKIFELTKQIEILTCRLESQQQHMPPSDIPNYEYMNEDEPFNAADINTCTQDTKPFEAVNIKVEVDVDTFDDLLDIELPIKGKRTSFVTGRFFKPLNLARTISEEDEYIVEDIPTTTEIPKPLTLKCKYFCSLLYSIFARTSKNT